MRAEIARIQRSVGVTTLYVTHDQVEAMTLGDQVAVMRDGVLQQVGVPSEIYERPANLFVAAFIGTPPMNLVEATLIRDDGVPTLRFGRNRIGLDEEVFAVHPGLRRYEDRQVVLGIRPPDLVDAALLPNAPADARIVAAVSRTEKVGPDVYVSFHVDAPLLMVRDPRDAEQETEEPPRTWAAERINRFTARLDERTGVREGDTMELAVKTKRLHVFDPVTGDAIGD
jgi:multiple sugar transport system ATP-binding protein